MVSSAAILVNNEVDHVPWIMLQVPLVYLKIKILVAHGNVILFTYIIAFTN